MGNLYSPLNLSDALNLMEQEDVTVLAGGTDLMVRSRVWSGADLAHGNVLDIGNIEQLRSIRVENGYLVLGACCTMCELLSSSEVPEHMKMPLRMIGVPSIRNAATIGGNICNASPAADSLPMLYALDAKLNLQTAGHAREINISDFITAPGKNILQKDELLCEISVPLCRWSEVCYRKVGTRQANSLAKVSFFAVSQIKESIVSDVRISFGAVAPCVVRQRDIERLLVGKSGREIGNVKYEISAQYAELLKPIDDQRSTREYRQAVARQLLDDFLLSLCKYDCERL